MAGFASARPIARRLRVLGAQFVSPTEPCRKALVAVGAQKGYSRPRNAMDSIGREFSSGGPPSNVQVDQRTKTVIINPLEGQKHEASVIFLHGLGDTAYGWFDAAYWFSKDMPNVKFILPTASDKPVTLNMGMMMPSWYDIKGLSERSNESCEGIRESEKLVKGLIDRETQAGIPHSKIVLGGFSQGAALSMFTALQLRDTLAGVIAMSGYLPVMKELSELGSINTATPVIMCHGDSDPMVRLDWAKASKEFLEKNSVQVEWHVYEGMEHNACVEELEHVKTFIKQRLQLD